MWTRFTFALYALPVGIWLLIEADTNARAAWCVRAPEKMAAALHVCLCLCACLHSCIVPAWRIQGQAPRG